MNKIQYEHIKSITECIKNDETSGYSFNMVTSEASTIITLKHIKLFAEWLDNNCYKCKDTNHYCFEIDRFNKKYTLEQLIQEYIKTL